VAIPHFTPHFVMDTDLVHGNFPLPVHGAYVTSLFLVTHEI
jgi:hypothetical protein